jgi:uncharacterized protein DUF4158
VEFLSDHDAVALGRYGESVPQADLERFFFLDDAERELVTGLRGDHNRLGFNLQLTTARYIGRFLADPLEGVPTEVLDFLAGQLRIADPSCVKWYAVREQTHREHAARIRTVLGLRDFAQAEAELVAWVDTRTWVTGDGPKAIFADAVAWLRERDVLLPGVSRLARLVAGAGRGDGTAVGDVVRSVDSTAGMSGLPPRPHRPTGHRGRRNLDPLRSR